MLFSFFIIHPPLCKHEGDEISKILYYYPSTDSNEKKLKNIGLGEALIAISKKFNGTCEALKTKKYIHGFLEPENNFLISLVIENPDSNISHALISSVISDWYELFVRFNGPIGSLGSTEESISILDSFYTKCIQNMPVYSYSLPELFRSFNFESDKIWQMDLLYLISRISDRFENPSGHLFFHQNEILSSNLDRQTIYIIMLYLNHYIKDYENGFLTLPYNNLHKTEKSPGGKLLAYFRQNQMLVLIFDDDEKIDLQKLKIFLDKNLVLKDFPSDGSKPKNDQKNEINFFLCNDINGISNENMFQYKYINGSKQPKLHPDVNNLIIEFQQTYLIPNRGEISAQTHDGNWILTKAQNDRTGVFVHRSAPDKNLAEVTSEVNQLCLNELKNSIKFESP